MTQEEQHIRELAYDIWQSEGCPEGQDERHWEMARKLVEAQGGTGMPTAKPDGKARKTATKPVDATPSSKTAKKNATGAQSVKPAKAGAAAKGSARPGPEADTNAQAGNPESIKKTRTPRSTGKSSN